MNSSAGWFNDSDYSDITLKLRDDREIKAHRLIICKQNKYFASLCGPSTSFAKAKMSKLELAEDDPDAVEEVLRKIYGCTLPVATTKTSRSWLQLMITAEKYREPKLRSNAFSRLSEATMRVKNADEIFDVIQSLKADMNQDERCLWLAESLRKKHFDSLIRNERYRSLLLSDPELLMSHFDEMAAARCSKCRRCIT